MPGRGLTYLRYLRYTTAVGVLVLGCVVSMWFWSMSSQEQREYESQHLEQAADRARHMLLQYIDAYIRALHAARGVFDASENVEAHEWARFVRSLLYTDQYAGMGNLTFVANVAPGEVASFVARRHAEGRTKFTIHPQVTGGDYFLVDYFVPEYSAPNFEGWNVACDPRRLEALRKARDGNELVVTSSVELHLHDGIKRGVVMYLPVYRRAASPDTIEVRRRELQGWVAIPLTVEHFAQALLPELGEVNLTIYDGPGMAYENQLLALGPPDADDAVPPRRVTLAVGDREWTLRLALTQGAGVQMKHESPLMELGVGLGVSVLLFMLVLTLTHTKTKALDLAARMTSDLRASEEKVRKLALVAARTDNAVIIMDGQARIEWVNDGFTRLTGFEFADATGRAPTEFLMGPESDQAKLAELQEHIERGTGFELEVLVLRKTGESCWVSLDFQFVRDDHGRVTNLIAIGRDVTERRRTEQQLLFNSTHDILTGLPNRVVLIERLNWCIQHARRNADYHFAVLFLDLDRFKLINDSLGHLIGDELLKTIAGRLRNCLRAADTVARQGNKHTIARLGGDEFIILLDGISDAADAIRVAERIQRELEMPVNVGGQDVVASVSIGIALSDLDYDKAEDLLRDADNAMYRAKSAGRARYVVFDQQMHQQITKQLSLESDMRKAVDKGEFIVHYQPIISLDTRRLMGFEALVRWKHPTRGMVSPADFIPMAEETGLIVPLGRWVLLEACRQLARWQSRYPEYGDLAMSVNLSVRQLEDAELIEQVSQILRATGVRPGTVKLEITESAMMKDVAATTNLLKWLRKLNVQLYMDDFGTGYSSLSCLHRVPIDGLKIDRAFVQSMGQRSDYTAVVQAIISLAHNLGMKVVAEGIETQDQLIQLQTLDCKYGQGFLFARPMPSDAVDGYIRGLPQAISRVA